MFAYNPGVADRSGEILGEGANNAAMLTMRSMENFGENIGNALSDIAGQYAQKEGMKRAGKAYKQTLPIFASALGIGDEQLKQLSGMDDMDLYYAMESIRPALPSMINAQLGQQRMGVQQGAPILGQNIKDANTRAEEGPSFDGTMLP